MNKKRKIRIISIVIGVILIIAIYSIILTIKIKHNMEFFEIFHKDSFWVITNTLIFSLTGPSVIPIALIIGGIIAINKYYKGRLDENDLKKYHGYYRDIIKNYSPAVLSYIDNFYVDEETIIGTIMNLEKNGYIEINDKLNIINNDFSNLNNNEKFILNLIKSNNLHNINYKLYEKTILNDCYNSGLLKSEHIDNTKGTKKIATTIFTLIIVAMIFMSIFMVGFFNPNIQKLMNIFMSVFPLIMIIVTISIFAFIFSQHILLRLSNGRLEKRTHKGKLLNENLEGLKNFLKDFSKLDEKTKDYIILWDDYLIYSVIFKQNKKIISEYKKLFQTK